MKEATKRAASEALAQMLAVMAMLVIASIIFHWRWTIARNARNDAKVAADEHALSPGVVAPGTTWSRSHGASNGIYLQIYSLKETALTGLRGHVSTLWSFSAWFSLGGWRDQRHSSGSGHNRRGFSWDGAKAPVRDLHHEKTEQDCSWTRSLYEASIKVELEEICDLPTDLTISVQPDGDSWKVAVMQEGSEDDAERREMIEQIAARLKAEYDLKG
jgi:hypothetical protein